MGPEAITKEHPTKLDTQIQHNESQNVSPFSARSECKLEDEYQNGGDFLPAEEGDLDLADDHHHAAGAMMEEQHDNAILVVDSSVFELTSLADLQQVAPEKQCL